MNRRAAVLAALAASFLPVPAPAADSSVPIARAGGPLAGEAPPASLLRPATLGATFRVREPGSAREPAAQIDGLTGIANRPALDDALARACEHAAAAQEPLAAVLVDVDHFRRYNELYGHLAGDDVLRHVAAALASVTSHHAGALAGRYAGKEFLALLPHADLPAAKHIAASVLAAIDALEIAHGGAPLRRLTASIGVAAITPSNQTTTTTITPTTAADLVRRASTAAYIAKAMGRARVVADEPMLAPAPEAARC